MRNALRNIFTLRVNVYSHFARSFYGLFDPEDLKEGVRALFEFVELLGDADTGLKNACDLYHPEIGKIAPEDLDSLQFEYNRLFVGPARLIAPPYESVYRTGELLVMSEVTMDVRKAYGEAGLRMRNILKEPEDHIATELEYLVELQTRCLAALDDAAGNELVRNVSLQKDFLEDHLLLWVPQFCREIMRGSQMEFFTALGNVLDQFLRADSKVLSELDKIVNEPSTRVGVEMRR